MSKEWDRLYNILSKRGIREPEFVELNEIHNFTNILWMGILRIRGFGSSCLL